MLALRWILGLILGVGGAGMLAILIAASGFARSFGSEGNPLVIPAVGVALAVLFAGILFPGIPILLHVGAAVAAALIAGVVIAAEGNFSAEPCFYIAYLVLWLVYYWLAAWNSVGSGARVL